jgi:tyrosinase
VHDATAAGSLAIIPGYSGTISVKGLPGIPPGTPLTMETPLYPFERAGGGAWYTSADVMDVEAQLGYSYASGSLDPLLGEPFLGAPHTALITGFKRTHGINRAEFPGSFAVRTFAQVACHDVEISRDAVLSRWNVQGYANCRDKLDVESLVSLDEVLLNAIKGADKSARVEYSAEIQTHHVGGLKGAPFAGPKPIVADL